MKTKDLLKLAEDPRFIEGIYNYCDRWCERCAFTGRCLLFAQEQAEDIADEARDVNNEAFWERLTSAFQQTREMIEFVAAEEGIDLNAIDLSAGREEQELLDRVESHDLSKAAETYVLRVNEWFDQHFPELEQALTPQAGVLLVDFDLEEKTQRVADDVATIRWYQFQIAVKIRRGLMHAEPEDGGQKDSDGSVKVALIGIDRSISAWGRLKEEYPEKADSALALLVDLDQLRRMTEQTFPNARKFIRPGFDEAPDTFVS